MFFQLLMMATLANTAVLNISSPDFKKNGPIPAKYTCEGQNINPAISIKDIPAGTKSLALIVDDPDAPSGTFDHWILWNIKPGNIAENSAPGEQGKNGWGKSKYGGPCPPSGTHHYHFKVFALDAKLNLSEASDKSTLKKAMEGHIIGKGELVGTYKKMK